jgi:hypothetical protein
MRLAGITRVCVCVCTYHKQKLAHKIYSRGNQMSHSHFVMFVHFLFAATEHRQSFCIVAIIFTFFTAYILHTYST